LFLGGLLAACITFFASVRPEPETAAAAEEYFVYLPLVVNPAQPVAVPNGDFESGYTIWVESSTNDYALIIDSGFPSNVIPRSGSWAAWLGGFKNETSTIQQQVTVPPSAPYLAYWHWILSTDYCGYDVASVRVNGTAVSTYSLCTSANTNGWVRQVINLSAYAGQTVNLEFRAVIDHSLRSDLFIDDVVFQSSANAVLEDEVGEE
jgi:hypothetical protein